MPRESSLAVVIPTRNRPEFAITALRSALAELPEDGRVLVSDNSSAENRARLSELCRQIDDPRLSYLEPPSEMAMTPHWEWALEQALTRTDASHVAFLTDRMVFRDGAMADAWALARENPGDLVTYNVDHVEDRGDPMLLIQYPWTGRAWRLDSRRLLGEPALGRFPATLPRMLNCIAPRELLGRLSARFGTVFGSAAESMCPDYSFAYQALDLLDHTLHYDRSVLMDAGFELSSGASYARGVFSEDAQDFVETVGAEAINRAAPLPELPIYPNSMVHEYCAAMAESDSGKFGELSMGRYLAALARGATVLEDQELRRSADTALAEAGWSGPRRLWHSLLTAGEELRYGRHPRDLIRRVLWRKRARLSNPGPVLRALLQRLRMSPGGASRLDAFEYANAHPVERVRRPAGIGHLIARERPAGRRLLVPSQAVRD